MTKIISDKLNKAFSTVPIKDKDKLQRQQDYYKNLSEKGVIRKQTYNLKSFSAI